MPLPILIPIAIAAGGALFGGKKVLDAKENQKEIEKIVSKVKKEFNTAVAKLDLEKKNLNRKTEEYAKLVISIRSDTFQRVILLIEKIGKKSEKKIIDILESMDFSPGKLAEFKTEMNHAKDFTKGSLKSASAGLAAGNAAIYLVGNLATASTGAAISGLSVA
jgi:hypothetical protein